MTELAIQKVGIIGFGEAGRLFCRDLAAIGIDVSVFDILICESQTRDAILKKAQDAKVRATETLEDAIRNAELVISLVTASAATGVAKKAATFLRRGQIYMDANSVSPETKNTIAGEIAKSEGDFVEATVLAPVPPQGYKVPLLLGGARADDLALRLRSIGMDATAVSERIGVASAIKMCRSVVMKGLNALVMESLFAARRYGAEDAVLSSLDATYPSMGWGKRLPDTMMYRAAEHSRRRAAEMREVAQTLKDAGVSPLMATSTAELQEWLTKQMEAKEVVLGSSATFSWRAFADTLADKSKSNGN